jgi:UDP-N-acetylglucosamine 2-epimerase
MTRSSILEALHDATWVITDSGGLQKEAFFAGRRCIVLRSETEWTELVESGWTALINPDQPGLEALIRAQFTAWQVLGTPAVPELYGDGRSAVRMAKSLAAGLHILNQ